ncbi:recombinase family protein, partial [Pseudomonas syringae pv. tagetis]|uniref:recombinase family protein n=1 Tax=Pseudomonas syringae group genomosp. 7 TaxID=251699 RepID=UPI00377054F1
MSRQFAYCRVRTTDQTTMNQIHEIKRAGFAIEPHSIVTENNSGSVAASDRPGYGKLLQKK